MYLEIREDLLVDLAVSDDGFWDVVRDFVQVLNRSREIVNA